MNVATLVNKLGVDAPSPLLKQSPTTIMFAIAVVMSLAIPQLSVSDPVSLASASVGIVLATAFAAFLTVRPSLQHLALIVPTIDFLAIGALRYGTGDSSSIFASLVVLPVVWFAVEEGRRYILFAFLGTAVALLLPFLLGNTAGGPPSLLRAAYASVAFAIAAAVINELSRHARLRLYSARALSDQRVEALNKNLEHTERLAESEAKLRQAELLYRGLWGAVTEQSVIGTDVTGRIDAWNPGAARLLDLPAEAVQDIRYVDEFHLAEELEDRSRELEYPAGATVLNPGFSALVEPARLGSADVREWTYVRHDGERIPVELSVTPRTGENGEIIGYLFVAFDMTKAREVARLKDEFVGLISHELRTPLSSILGYLELIRDEDETELSADQLQYLAVAERNAHRLLRLVGDLLFTAQVESGTFTLDLQRQDLSPILSASLESARPQAAATGITLRADVPAGFFAEVDAVRLGQACDNLISNAIKFTPRGGTVTVALAGAERDAVVRVSDTGIGIAQDELDKVFGKFFRASTATRNAVPGVGLGLAITKAIVKAHGGDMDVASEEGVGTAFSLSVPLVNEPALV
ncbi:sensor histidine kinase [Planctomonas psychrotolerans]|uniref:sensor histidine kinase n=1 Tax=Planctomonas psychrotolerans TaxID=2528712 RepID=UPI00123C666F|nr:ATP-binding protein [Planctomonas psychrotolerans]